MSIQWKVTLSDIDYGPEEEAAVLAVLRSKWLSMGPRVQEFEQRFAESAGCAHAIAVANGTAALHLALAAVGVGPGDEVIVPSLTFVASANAVLYCGATPVFGDICSAELPLLDPDDVERKLTSRTKAIMPVHYAGYLCDMDRFRKLAAEHDLRIVQDAAHATGVKWRGTSLGSLGDAACFSFFSNKNLPTGEGGMILTDDDDLAAAVRLSRAHGMTRLSYDRQKGHASEYDVVTQGYNYRCTEIEAALGIEQLRKLERNNQRRRELVKAYCRRLKDCRELLVPFDGLEAESSCHIFPVVLGKGLDREAIRAALQEDGIQTSVHYRPVHEFATFSGRFEAAVPKVDQIAARLVTLPLHPLMSEDDVELVCDSLKRHVDAAAPSVEQGSPA